jgi:hypothetical protein
VNIMSMLVRLQGTLGCTDLVSQMVLLPHQLEQGKATPTQAEANSEINLVVGYNSSPGSQTALDLILWIAHQTRLATGKQVTVQVVYVVDKAPESTSNNAWGKRTAIAGYQKSGGRSLETASSGRNKRTQRASTALAEELNPVAEVGGLGLAEQFEQADRILWQARCLADEWRGSLKTHLRFGNVAEELRHVAQVESAALLLLGCTSRDNPVVQGLVNTTLPCPVLGIPTELGEG